MQHTRLTIILRALMAATISLAGHAALNQSAAAAAIEQAAPNKPWSAEAYRVQWEDPQVPEEVAANLKIAMPRDRAEHRKQGMARVAGFRGLPLCRDHRLVVWDGERTALPRDLGAGSRTALSVSVVTPAEPGSHVLQLTLVHELVTWFETKGAATVLRPIAVRPPTRDGVR